MNAPTEQMDLAKPRKVFRRFSETRLMPDRARRQGLVTNLAFTLLGGRDDALLFLNTYHDGLAARPLDLAMESGEGFVAVEQALRHAASLPVGEQS